MAAYQRVTLATMVMLLAFLIFAMRTTIAFEVSANYQDEKGVYLVQDEGKAPMECYSLEKVVEKLVEADPGVKVYKHTSSGDNSSAIIGEFSTGSGVLMVIEPGEMLCDGAPLHPMQVYMGRQTADEDPSITTIQIWPPEKTGKHW